LLVLVTLIGSALLVERDLLSTHIANPLENRVRGVVQRWRPNECIGKFGALGKLPAGVLCTQVDEAEAQLLGVGTRCQRSETSRIDSDAIDAPIDQTAGRHLLGDEVCKYVNVLIDIQKKDIRKQLLTVSHLVTPPQ
jgi:hypothetical protein